MSAVSTGVSPAQDVRTIAVTGMPERSLSCSTSEGRGIRMRRRSMIEVGRMPGCRDRREVRRSCL